MEILAFAAGAAMGASSALAAVILLRRRHRAAKPTLQADEPMPVRPIKDEAPPLERSPERDLDAALTDAVSRAIAKGDAELDLQLQFPDRCRLFGREVQAKGSVAIASKGDEEVWEAIRVVGRRVSEVEAELKKRMEALERSLSERPVGAEAAGSAEAGICDGGEEEVPIPNL